MIKLLLSNYNSFFELFAGLSAALTGFDKIRDFLTDKLNQRVSKLKQKIDSTIVAFKGLTEQLRIKNDKKGGEVIYKNVVRHLITLQNDKESFDKVIEIEITKNKQSTIAMFSYVFCTCVFWIILAGVQSDGLYPKYIIPTFATHELLSIPTLILIGVLEHTNTYCLNRPVRVGVITGITIAILSIILPHESGFELLSHRWLVAISFLICLLPILLLLLRGVVIGPYTCMKGLKIEENLRKMQPDIDAAEKWLYRNTMPPIFVDIPNFDSDGNIDEKP